MKTKNAASPAVEKTIWILRIVPPSQEHPIIGREVYIKATKVTGTTGRGLLGRSRGVPR
jgi:hypothetical protein